MIGDGLFQSQIEEVERLLTVADLFDERVLVPNKSLGASHFKRLSYRESYEECIRTLSYDVRLADQSLLLFVKSGSNPHDGSLSYSYYDCPAALPTYKEFVGSLCGVDAHDDQYEETIAEWGDDLRTEYEAALSSSDLKASVTPIRYDYKASDYREGVHPAAHLHIGFGNELRLASRKVMNPLSFTLMIVRQRYPRQWERIREAKEFASWKKNIRSRLDGVVSEYWSARDQEEEVFLY